MHQARDQLEKILSDPEFGRNKKKFHLGDFDLFLPSPDFSVPREVTWAAWAALAVFLMVLLVWLARAGWMRWPARMREGKRDQSASPSRGHWLELAAGLAGRGEYRPAVRALYLGVLESAFEQRKLLRHIAKTNGEYRDEADRNWPERADEFRELSTVFDEVWYGNRPIDGGDFDRYRSRSLEIAEMRDPDET